MEKRIDRIKEELRGLGFVTAETDDAGWLSFKYSDLTFRFTVDEEQDFLAIGLGFSQEHSDVDRAKILEFINRMNAMLNYVKIIELGDAFWLTYEVDVERRMPDEEDIRDIIMVLTGGYYRLIRVYAEMVGQLDGGEEEENGGAVPGAFDWDGYVSDEKRGDNDDNR